jgi:hypothetical protein
MPLLNYTTTIGSHKTIGEISTLLAKAKVHAIMQEYDKDGNPSAISFRITTQFGVMTYLLPCEAERVYKVICRDEILPYSQRSLAKARMIAWRIVKDWIEAQLAMIQCGLVDIEQVFLPYAQAPDGTTLYEKLKAEKFAQLALPPHE